MKKNQTIQEIVLSEEFFEIKLDCDTKSIDITSLIKYLSETNLMVQGINETLNTKYNSGFVEIEIEAFALEEGSIRIPLKFKKYAFKSLFALVINILGGIAVDLISGKNEPIVILTTNEEVESNSAIFLENSKTKRSVGKIARLTVDNDSITSLSVTYEKNNGQRETLTITKETLDRVATECENVDDDTIIHHPNVRMAIYGPILENKPSSWQVILNDRRIHVQMADKDFLEEMTAKKIAFAPGDEIIADVDEINFEDDKGEHKKWIIRKVHSYPKYTRITKNSKPNNLFN